MTTHELAQLLLSLPDVAVVISVYTGGDDELMEIKDALLHVDQGVIELKTYKE